MHTVRTLAPARRADAPVAALAGPSAMLLRAGSAAVRAVWIVARAAVLEWRRRRRIAAGLRELRELDARMLADIGLDRGAVFDAAWRGRGRSAPHPDARG